MDSPFAKKQLFRGGHSYLGLAHSTRLKLSTPGAPLVFRYSASFLPIFPSIPLQPRDCLTWPLAFRSGGSVPIDQKMGGSLLYLCLRLFHEVIQLASSRMEPFVGVKQLI